VLGLALTAFLFFHLGVAALAFVPARYDAAAHLLRALAGRVPIVEAVLLLLVATQAGVGIRLLARSGLRYDSGRCKDDGKLRYFLQRWSAVAILAFLALHLAMFKLRLVEESFAALSRRFTLGGSALLTGFYVFVLAGVAFHAGNGLWTGASVWGLRENHPFLWRGISISTGALVAILGFFALGFFVK
jgi:succinate dehydrogenase/fumarate reductase cytochrome b subunit